MEEKIPDLQQIKHSTLLDYASVALRDSILNGDVKPGDRVNEVTFTNKMGISRTTFREALRQLEQAGLLVRIPYRGTFVREFSEEEIRDLNNLRGVLECYAAEIIIEHGDNQVDKLAPLYQIVNQMEGIDPAKNAAETNALHISFHRTLLDIAGNQLLFRSWNDLAQQFWMAMRVSQLSFIATGEALGFAEAHRRVADAIASGDIAQVREIIHKHIS